MKKIAVVVPMIIIAAAIMILIIPRGSPIERTIDNAVDAASAHDYMRFRRLVNVRGLIDSYLKLIQSRGGAATENTDEIERRLQYYIETERIPDPDRFKNVIATHVLGEKAEAMIALELKRYSIVCTTAVFLQSKPNSGWQIEKIDLRGIYRKVNDALLRGRSVGVPHSLNAEAIGPEALMSIILYDTGAY